MWAGGENPGKRLCGQAADRAQGPSGNHSSRKMSCGERQTAYQESPSKGRGEKSRCKEMVGGIEGLVGQAAVRP